MSTHKETRLVHCYDPVAFVIAVEQGVKDGFSLDLVTPEHYPQQIGWQFITTMVKDSVEGKDETVKGVTEPVEAPAAQQEGVGSQEVTKEVVEAPKKAGRPAKTK